MGSGLAAAVHPSDSPERRVSHQSARRARLRVGTDARPTAEQILAVDLVASAAAAVAAANAGGGCAATAVRHQRQPSPAPATDTAGGGAPTTLRTPQGPSPALAANDADGGAPTTVRTRREPSPAPAADSDRGGAPTTIRHRREPSPAPVIVYAGACSRPASPSRSPSPPPDVPAVNFNVPKSMGSSLDWTDEDRVPLCRAFLQVSVDPVMATGR